MTFKCYTDGACQMNGKENAKGGWAFVAIDNEGNIRAQECGGEIGTTNNRMELMAVVYGLNFAIGCADISEKIEIYSDSAYVVNCFKQGPVS